MESSQNANALGVVVSGAQERGGRWGIVNLDKINIRFRVKAWLDADVDAETEVVNVLGVVNLGAQRDHHHVRQRLLKHTSNGA